MSNPFVAEIRIFPFSFAPKGWAFCAGQLMPKCCCSRFPVPDPNTYTSVHHKNEADQAYQRNGELQRQ